MIINTLLIKFSGGPKMTREKKYDSFWFLNRKLVVESTEVRRF